MSTSAALPLSGYFPKTVATPAASTPYAAPVLAPVPTGVASTAAPATTAAPVATATTTARPLTVASTTSGTVSAQSLGSNGPILPLSADSIFSSATKVVPAATYAAIGSATAIAANTSAAMSGNVAHVVGTMSEPLFALSWGIVSDLANSVGSLLTLNIPGAIANIGRLFSDGFVNTGNLLKRLVSPATLTAATSGGAKLSLGGALATGFRTAGMAIRSSAVFALPAAAINAFVDYKYKDTTDPKRVASNFIADVVGYTATGMIGAGVGAAIGSMTVPIVGTIVGAGVGILLGMVHDKIFRPMISDKIDDML